MPLFVSLIALLMMVAAPPQDTPDETARYLAARTGAGAEDLLAARGWAPARTVEWGPAAYTTRFRALWHEDGLLVRFDAVDPDPWHTLTERDDHLWNEEVVEIFIDPDGDGRNYAEIEINPANVVCDLVIFEGSPNLRSDIAWDHRGIRTRVHPMRDAAGETIGWTAVALLPWEGFALLPEADGVRLPPAPGDRWRFNVFRIKRPGGPSEPERDAVYAAWSSTSGPSFHEPAVFRELEFGE